MNSSGILNFTMPSTGSFLVEIIVWLVKISSSIALGIVLFTVILKLITLPFDYMSRASMRKNSLKMEEMRPELEKLQKQYADNKDLYNQKMLALYKKNGYSMFGACLPTILTLVIFIVALNAFTDYSKYQNKMDFYQMSKAYNNVIYSGLETDDIYITRNEKGELVINDQELYDALGTNDSITIGNIIVENNSANSYITVKTVNGYVEYKRDYVKTGENEEWKSIYYSVIEDAKNNYANLIKNEDNNNLVNLKGQTYEEASQEYENLNKDKENEDDRTLSFNEFINDIQSIMSAKKYREVKTSFLWIKNIWVTDSPTKHPVESSWSAFKTTHSYKGDVISSTEYKNLIKHLDKETSEPNGYFILVILTAGISLLTQIVMGKTQKAQMELQTVDGQGAQTQKIMKWMMPIMMAIFAFMYTSAFSIYIILSSTISLLTTFAINAIVDAKFKKENANKKTEVIRGRVYVAKEEVKEEPKKKVEEATGDFLSGTADGKKHIRGRIK